MPAPEQKQGVRAGRDDDVPSDGVARRAGGEERVQPVAGVAALLLGLQAYAARRRLARFGVLVTHSEPQGRDDGPHGLVSPSRNGAKAATDSTRTLDPMTPGQEMPLRTAWTAAWMRLSRWSLARMLAMWLWMVLVLSESS